MSKNIVCDVGLKTMKLYGERPKSWVCSLRLWSTDFVYNIFSLIFFVDEESAEIYVIIILLIPKGILCCWCCYCYIVVGGLGNGGDGVIVVAVLLVLLLLVLVLLVLVLLV